MSEKSEARTKDVMARREAQTRYNDGRRHRKNVVRAVIGLLLATSILLPMTLVGFNALSAGANQQDAESDTTESIDPTKMSKAQRKELIESYGGKDLTKEQKDKFIETGSISSSAPMSSASPSATQKEKVTESSSTPSK